MCFQLAHSLVRSKCDFGQAYVASPSERAAMRLATCEILAATHMVDHFLKGLSRVPLNRQQCWLSAASLQSFGHLGAVNLVMARYVLGHENIFTIVTTGRSITENED